MVELETDGLLFLAGPLSDDAGEHMSGVGPILLQAASLDDARDLAQRHPMHVEGIRIFTLQI